MTVHVVWQSINHLMALAMVPLYIYICITYVATWNTDFSCTCRSDYLGLH